MGLRRYAAGIAGLVLLLAGHCAEAQLTSLNQTGDTPCAAHLWVYGSALNSANHALPSCFPQFTNGSVLFSGTVAGQSGGVTQDNSNFFWDGTNHRLGLGSAVPQVMLDVFGDIRDHNVLNCSGGGKVLTTDSNGTLVCHTMICSVGAPSCSCSCSATGGCSCTCSIGATSCALN